MSLRNGEEQLALGSFEPATDMDELSSNPDAIPVTEEQLDRCFEEYRHDPDKVVTWEEAKARILSGRR